MNLQGRNIALNTRGDDVALLQTELRQLDFQIADPAGLFGSTTLLAVRRFQADHDIPVTGIVDARTATLINQAIEVQPRETWLVQGRLLRWDGTPPLRSAVRAFAKQLRRDISLGEAVPDAAGAYRITYVIPQERDLSLIVRAFDASGNEIAASSVVCHARKGSPRRGMKVGFLASRRCHLRGTTSARC